MTTQLLTRFDEQEQATADSAAAPAHTHGHRSTLFALRLLASGALLVSAYTHIASALRTGLDGQLFTMPQLFMGQGLACIGVAVWLLVRDRELNWLPAVAVAIGSFVPILASVYFPLPAIGPMPPINEPIWYGEKILAFVVTVTVPLLYMIRRIAPPAR